MTLRRRGTVRSVALFGLCVLTASACAGSPDSSEPSASGASDGSLIVAAAASLTDVFGQIGEAYLAANPGVEVTFSFAGSSGIAEQIRQGAPIDVFASAGTIAMAPVADEGLVTGVTDFAINSLAIATPPGNPGGIRGLADLDGTTFIVCQVEVPCGLATAELLEINAVDAQPVSYESNVRAVLTKVEADEADAGIVYVTDIRAAGDAVMGIPIAPEDNVPTTYQAAVVTETGNAEGAAAFVAFLSTDEAQAILAAAGFEAP